MLTLTSQQTRVLEFIQRYMDDNGMPPTRADIARALHFRSTNAAEDHLRALARKGMIELLPGASRGLRLKGAPTMNMGMPVIGRVAAGSPILAEQHIEAHYQVDPALFRPHADYLLKVQGMSMRDVGIMDGDLLAVHRIPTAENGQIVVARLGDEVTVKRFQRQKNKVLLLPENSEFAPIIVNLEEQSVIIEGLGVGVLRNGGLT